jgi:hypothetical protein
MERRRFLGLTILGPSLVALRRICWPAFVAGASPRTISFYVAGARFYANASLRTGDSVKVEQAIFNDKPCYPIYGLDGGQIGHVPKHLIPLVRDAQIVNARVSLADRYAVPWKRYEVTLALS